MTPTPLKPLEKRQLRAMAQRLDSMVHLGRNGLDERFLKELNDALTRFELVKVRFVEFKDQKKVWSPRIAELTGSHLIARVGHVAVYYREPTDASKRRIVI